MNVNPKIRILNIPITFSDHNTTYSEYTLNKHNYRTWGLNINNECNDCSTILEMTLIIDSHVRE